MPRFRMFIDDTGSIENTTSNHPQQRFGGIVGVIFELTYLETVFQAGFDQLRERHFGKLPNGALPVLHLRKMKRADPNGPFRSLIDVTRRTAWERDCFSMFKRATYTVIAVCVDKPAFYARHPRWDGSIYELLVGNAIERFVYFLRQHQGTGDVMAEAVNANKDAELRSLYSRSFAGGTDHLSASRLQEVLSSREIKIKPKSQDVAGLQIADLLASTCFSHLRRTYSDGTEFYSFAMQIADLIEREKFYRNPQTGDPHGYGRIWRP